MVKRTVIGLMALVLLTVASAAWAETQQEAALRMWKERQQAEKQREQMTKNATTVAKPADKPTAMTPDARKAQSQANQNKHMQDMLGIK